MFLPESGKDTESEYGIHNKGQQNAEKLTDADAGSHIKRIHSAVFNEKASGSVKQEIKEKHISLSAEIPAPAPEKEDKNTKIP